jgi:hypothetical protein
MLLVGATGIEEEEKIPMILELFNDTVFSSKFI